MATKAYAYRSGEIGFTTGCVPAGALYLASTDKAVDIVKGLARRAYDNETLLVPGVPEAPDEEAALRAFTIFFDRVQLAIAKHGNGI